MTELDLKIQELKNAFNDLKEENKRFKFSNSILENELQEYRQLEEQGLLLKLKQVSVNDVVDKLFSHNEIISLWRKVKDEVSYRKRIWYGMVWDIPEELKNCKFVKIFGTIPESIAHADIINIEVALSEEAEKALEEMEK